MAKDAVIKLSLIDGVTKNLKEIQKGVGGVGAELARHANGGGAQRPHQPVEFFGPHPAAEAAEGGGPLEAVAVKLEAGATHVRKRGSISGQAIEEMASKLEELAQDVRAVKGSA